MDSQSAFPLRQALSKPLLHRLLAERHQSREHVRGGHQVSARQVSRG